MNNSKESARKQNDTANKSIADLKNEQIKKDKIMGGGKALVNINNNAPSRG